MVQQDTNKTFTEVRTLNTHFYGGSDSDGTRGVCVNECIRITQEKEAAPLSSAKKISGPT